MTRAAWVLFFVASAVAPVAGGLALGWTLDRIIGR